MAQTQAVYYRDKHGAEPVNEFIEALPAKRAAKIDEYVEEYLNGMLPQAPPPEFPISSQIDGELRVKMRRRIAEEAVEPFIKIDKLLRVATKTRLKRKVSPHGSPAASAAKARAARGEEYRDARDGYAAIRELRKKNWIAAHIRERRYELEMTQQEVAMRANTSHSFISKVERGDHIPTIPVLARILSVLDEQLLIGIERDVADEEPEREIAPAPQLAVA